jgi:cytochrome P450
MERAERQVTRGRTEAMAMQTVGGTTVNGNTLDAAVTAPASRCPFASARTLLMPARRAAARGGRPLPGPRGYPLVGMLPDLFHHVSALPLLRDAWRSYGDAVQLPMGPYTVCFFANPDAVKHILVDNRDNYRRAQYQIRWLSRLMGTGLIVSDGELHRRRRHIMHTLFTAKAVQGYATAMASAVQDVVGSWERRLALGQPEVELAGEMVRLSMGALSRSVLGFDAHASLDRMNEAILTVTSRVLHQAPIPLWLPTPANIRFRRAVRQFDELLYGVIRARRAAPETDTRASDVLSLMLRAEDDRGQRMSDQAVRDEALTFYFAGLESTSTALGWAFHALAQHPEVQRRLQEEVDRELGNDLPTAEVAERLTYTEMVVRETLRLYPSFAMIPKDVQEDDEIAGYRVPRGSIMVVSPHLTQRHPDLWPDPERFDPERHAPGQAERRHRYSWFPFGSGPHVCIGSAFALLEMKIAVAMIARRFRLSLQRPAQPADRLTPRPVGGIQMRLEPRR